MIEEEIIIRLSCEVKKVLVESNKVIALWIKQYNDTMRSIGFVLIQALPTGTFYQASRQVFEDQLDPTVFYGSFFLFLVLQSNGQKWLIIQFGWVKDIKVYLMIFSLKNN